MKNQLINVRTLPILLVAGIACSIASAQDFDSTLDTNASSANIDSMIVLDSTGALIGDYDPKTNPDGTQTRPGLFGGSGNHIIDSSVSMQADTTLDTNPTGSFTISPNFDLNTIEIAGMSIDLLNSSAGETDLSVSLLYSSFHTVSPSFLYPGGVPITLPLGQIGGISQATLTQTALGAGTITPTANPDIFDITVLVTAQLDMLINTSLPGQDPTDIPIEALPIVLPIIGQLEMSSTNSLSVTMSIAPDAVMVEVPIDGVALPDIPFELPTFGSDTASVIFTPTIDGISADALISLTLVANGELAACPADLTGDGNLNFFDVSAFLAAFAAMEPAADFTDDGLYNFFDVSAFLNAFSAGCP